MRPRGWEDGKSCSSKKQYLGGNVLEVAPRQPPRSVPAHRVQAHRCQSRARLAVVCFGCARNPHSARIALTNSAPCLAPNGPRPPRHAEQVNPDSRFSDLCIRCWSRWGAMAAAKPARALDLAEIDPPKSDPSGEGWLERPNEPSSSPPDSLAATMGYTQVSLLRIKVVARAVSPPFREG